MSTGATGCQAVKATMTSQNTIGITGASEVGTKARQFIQHVLAAGVNSYQFLLSHSFSSWLESPTFSFRNSWGGCFCATK